MTAVGQPPDMNVVIASISEAISSIPDPTGLLHCVRNDMPGELLRGHRFLRFDEYMR